MKPTDTDSSDLTLREWLWKAYVDALEQSETLRKAIATLDQTRGHEVDVALGCLRVLEAWASGIGGPKNPKAAKMARRAILALSATKTPSMAKNAVAGQKKAKAGPK
jgi:hypothetical protein